MTVFEIVSAVGLFAGPVSAVLITLWGQSRTQVHERRLDVARKLLNTHHDASEADYSSAIRLIPVEFRHDKRVLDAWRSLMQNVTSLPDTEAGAVHNSQFIDRKFRLIFEVCRSVNIKLTESEIRASVYEARSYTDKKKVFIDAQSAIVRIADHLEGRVAGIS